MEWSPYPAWNWIAAGVSILFAAMAWRTLRVPHGPPLGLRLLWLALRGALLALLLAILLHPHRVERREFREPLDVAVLLDDSASMSLRDEPGTPPRLEQLKECAGAMRTLAGGGIRLRWYRFADDAQPVSGPEAITATGRDSRIGKALETVLGDERTRSLGAVILASDGQTPDPDAARRAARLYRQANIPLYTLLVGTPEESPDLWLSDLTAAQESLYSLRVRLSGTLHAPGFVGRKVSLRVHCEGRLVHESFETVEADAKPFERTFDTPFTGFHRYQVEVRPEQGERLTDNNTGVVGAEVLDRKIRVINMEGTPNAGHYLENALEADPDIEVTSLFFPQTESFDASRKIPFTIDADGRKVYNIAHPIKGYPRTLQEMLTYDVVINSDIYKEAFTPEQLDLTVALVEEHGGGFVMVGGSTAFGAGHYDETVIDKLMPVDVYGNEGMKWSGFKLQVPEEMLDHPVMALGATREETARIWRERFPGFTGLNTVNRAKPGARVLAFNADQSNDYGPLVVFAVQQIGRGRTMAFTSDTTQSWGSQFHTQFGTSADKTLYYRRFWNQAVRWLAADRIRRKSGELKVHLDHSVAVPGESVDVRIPFPPTYPDAAITLRQGLPGEEAAPVELIRDEVTRTWHAEVPMKTQGEWIFTAGLPRPGLDPLFAHALVNVVPDTREYASTAANRDLMAELAQLGGGRLLEHDPKTWSVKVDPRGSRIIEYGRRAVWDRWWMMALLLALLTVEWGLRRRWIGGGVA
ncbi:MAG: glutamine amidotransferase [Verrucomicrobia bacterium]|nr:glutamine amidotransferase [Verrucomicrobiota bacterium]